MTEPRRFVSNGAFGRAGSVTWHADEDDDPSEVAAAIVQHQLVVGLREASESTGPLTAPRLAAAIGSADRTMTRRLAGESFISLPELMAWAASCGADLGQLVAAARLSDLPAEVLRLAPDWQSGSWTPPRFATSGTPLQPRWDRVAERIGRELEAEGRADRLGLVAREVLRHWAVQALTDDGISAAALHRDDELDGVRLDLIVDVDTRSGVAFLASLDTGAADPLSRVDNFRRSFAHAAWHAADAPADEALLIVATRTVSTTRMENLLPGFGSLSAGDQRSLMISQAQTFAPAGATADLIVTCVAVDDRAHADVRVTVLRITKT